MQPSGSISPGAGGFLVTPNDSADLAKRTTATDIVAYY